MTDDVLVVSYVAYGTCVSSFDAFSHVCVWDEVYVGSSYVVGVIVAAFEISELSSLSVGPVSGVAGSLEILAV